MSTKRRTSTKRGVERLGETSTSTTKVGVHADGRGLSLVVERSDAGVLHRRWVFRYTSPVTGKRREMGLGTPSDRGLVAVRKLATEYRGMVKDGKDPLDVVNESRQAERQKKLAEQHAKKAEAQREFQTLRRVARAFHETQIEPHRTGKHGQQWINSIEQHVPANILDKPIQDVTAKELHDALLSLRTKVRETGRRIGQRLGLIFAHAKLAGVIPVNPLADIKPLLRETKRDKKVQSHAALPFAEVPGFVRQLRAANGIGALALEFTLRCAARTGETIGATWGEVDLGAGIWTIPGKRMKGGEQHIVFLPVCAVEILREVQKLGSDYCFPSPQNAKRPLSNMAMLNVLKRLKVDDRTTVHGMRASFSTWAYESAQRQRPDLARPDVVEACLAHNEADKVKAAYSRSKFDDDRRELLALWSTFVDSKPAPVVNIVPGAQRSAA
jgi:integrase